MSNAEQQPLSDTQPKPSAPDDTAAFQAYYRAADQQQPSNGLLYRIFVGWWRDR